MTGSTKFRQAKDFRRMPWLQTPDSGLLPPGNSFIFWRQNRVPHTVIHGYGETVETKFVKLLMEHRSMLHSFIYALVRDPHLTEDILQEAAAVLWTKFAEFDPGTDFGAWARGVAWREIMAARRSEARAHRHLDEACARQILAAYERRCGAVDTTSHRLALGRCLESLGGDLRELMHCRYGLDMNSRQIGERLSRTAQAVDALVYRAKKLLSDCVRSRLAGQGEAP
jgi:RNA polymerase sigma-70 factor (ECF subfamily)